MNAAEPEVAATPVAGSFTLDGLLHHLEALMARLGDVRRVRLDTLEAFVMASSDPETTRGEIRRLFRWLVLISSLMDTWIVLEARRLEGRRRRFAWILKSRGTSHSDRLHELIVSGGHAELVPAPDAATWEG